MTDGAGAQSRLCRLCKSAIHADSLICKDCGAQQKVGLHTFEKQGIAIVSLIVALIALGISWQDSTEEERLAIRNTTHALAVAELGVSDAEEFCLTASPAACLDAIKSAMRAQDEAFGLVDSSVLIVDTIDGAFFNADVSRLILRTSKLINDYFIGLLENGEVTEEQLEAIERHLNDGTASEFSGFRHSKMLELLDDLK